MTEPTRTARTWLLHWPEIEPTVRRYQEPVPLARVLAEHAAAIAAEPADALPLPTHSPRN